MCVEFLPNPLELHILFGCLHQLRQFVAQLTLDGLLLLLPVVSEALLLDDVPAVQPEGVLDDVPVHAASQTPLLLIVAIEERVLQEGLQVALVY